MYRAPIRAFSAAAGAIGRAPALFPHSDLSYRALLRNLRLLAGLRGSQPNFKVLIGGLGAKDIGEKLLDTESALKLTIAEGAEVVDAAKSANPGSLDSIIVCQAYHVLPSGASLDALRTALHDEEGTLGLVWFRTLNEGWVADASRAAVELLPAGQMQRLGEKESPMTWMEHLDATKYDFKPLKHRKFIEKLEGSPADVMDLVRYTHDFRFPITGTSPAWDAVQGVATKAATGTGKLAVSMDLHSFHTSVVPRGKN